MVGHRLGPKITREWRNPEGRGLTFAGRCRVRGLGRYTVVEMLIRGGTEQTNLAGQVRTEINCLPVENMDFQQYVFRENKRRENEKPKIKMMKDGDDNNVVIPGSLASSGQFGDLIVRAFTIKLHTTRLLMKT